MIICHMKLILLQVSKNKYIPKIHKIVFHLMIIMIIMIIMKILMFAYLLAEEMAVVGSMIESRNHL